jgi:hypothetical protein
MNHHLPTEIQRAIKVAMFNQRTIQSVAKDKAVTPLATILIVLGSFAGALGSYVFPIEYGPVTYRTTVFEAIANGITAAFWIVVMLLTLNFVADRLFKGHGSFQSFLRVVGYGYIIGLFGLFPILSVLVGIWALIILFKALHYVKGLSVEQSALSLLLTAGFLLLLFSLLGEVTAANLYGGLYVLPT